MIADTAPAYTTDDFAELRESLEQAWPRMQRELRRSGVPLLDDDDDGGGDGDDDDGDGDDDDDDDDGDDSGDDDGDDGDGDDDERTAAVKAAEKRAEAAERKASEERKARRKAERELKKKKDAERREQGQHEERADELERENAELKASLRDGAYERAVLSAAQSLRFRDPADAISLLPRALREDAVDEDYEVDTTAIERALKAIAKSKKYLTHDEDETQTRTVRGDRQQERRNGKGDRDEYTFNPRGLEDAIAEATPQR